MMLIDILLPGITALIFLSAGIGWLMASLWHHSRLSHMWYGHKWAESFAPPRKSTTLLRASGFAAFYLLAGIAFLLMTLTAIYPSMRPLIYPIQWALLLLGLVFFGAAFLVSARRSQA